VHLTLRRHVLGIPPGDVALATVLLLASAGGLLSGEVTEKPLALTLPVAVATSLSLLGRTRVPLVAAAVVAAANLVQALWGSESPGTLMALVIILIVAYSLGAEAEESVAAVGLGLMLAALFTTEWLDDGSDYAFIAIELGGAWLLGRAARSWRSRATYAEQHQRDLALLAVADERTRIARELHDVVAHGLSVIAVQSDAAEAALARDPALAGPPLRAIRASARDALVDMRQLLHVLRTDGADERAPARGIDDLPDLVDASLRAGLPLETDIRVEPPLPAGISLAVYRIAQEGLTNVRKHAGAVPTCLEVVSEGSTVRVRVANGPARVVTGAELAADLSTGHGLLGARERVLAAGGTLHAGPTAHGGFELVAVLPVRGTSS
jgi:signal transduction histidine kinase